MAVTAGSVAPSSYSSNARIAKRRSAASLLVPRPRLLEGLVVEPAPISLICAPAGSGKTSLIRALLEASDEVPTAFVNVSQVDPSVPGVWDAIHASLSALDVSPADAGETHDRQPPVGVVGPDLIDNLVAAITAADRKVRLVLDDLHTIDDPATFRSLDALLTKQPVQLLLVLSTRHDPPLALHRHRLAGRLHEVRGADLAFHRDELVELLDRAGCELDTAGVELLHLHTEGWAAGIRIAVLSLLTGVEPEELLTDFGGLDQGVADYLMAEVLSTQSEEMRAFLLTTSACSTLPADLAIHLSGRDDAPEVLDDLVRRQALTERIERRRRIYRYHVVLRTYLDAERRRRHPESEARLQRTVGEWYAAQGQWLHALEHLARADAPERLLELLLEHSVTLMLDGQLDQLEGLLRGLPTELQQQPAVRLVRLLLASPYEQTGVALEMLAHLDLAALTAGGDHLVATLAALVQVQHALYADDLEQVLQEFVGRTSLPTGNVAVDLLVRHHRAIALLFLDRLDEANDLLFEVVDRARIGGRDALAISSLGHLATASLRVEDLSRSEEWALEARVTAARRGWMQLSNLLPTQIALAWISFQRVDRDAARLYLDDALALRNAAMRSHPIRYLDAIEVVIRLDGGEDAYQLLGDHRSRTRRPVSMSPQFSANFGPILVWSALMLGEQDWANGFARDYSDQDRSPGESDLMRAMLLVSAGHEAAAGKTLRRIIHGDVEVLVRSTLIYAHILSSTLAFRRASSSQAHDSLMAALRLADETGIVRPFINIGPEVHRQLIESADRAGHLASVARAIVSLIRGQPVGPVGHSLLTAAELSVLRDLPSLLSIRDIAESRSVSTNTIKTHLSAIYRKLGVNGRRAAVEVGRRQGLL
ncbi:MAG: hypothetical protein EA388_06385 [Nitriliruptor sp.]|nr:MAG: hypothetical protein EA388_06385 [Nitriliruptor sp.]